MSEFPSHEYTGCYLVQHNHTSGLSDIWQSQKKSPHNQQSSPFSSSLQCLAIQLALAIGVWEIHDFLKTRYVAQMGGVSVFQSWWVRVRLQSRVKIKNTNLQLRLTHFKSQSVVFKNSNKKRFDIITCLCVFSPHRKKTAGMHHCELWSLVCPTSCSHLHASYSLWVVLN